MFKEDQYQPRADVYHDPEEFIWKFTVSPFFKKIDEILKNSDTFNNDKVFNIRNKIIAGFNSNSSINAFNKQLLSSYIQLTECLSTLNKTEAIKQINKEFESVKLRIKEVLDIFRNYNHPNSIETNSNVFINDGLIEISGVPLEVFSKNEDYFSAMLMIFIGTEESNKYIAQKEFIRGFSLDSEEKKLIINAKKDRLDIVSLLNYQLLKQQSSGNYKSLLKYEYQPKATTKINDALRLQALEEACFLYGKIVSVIACYYHDSSSNEILDDNEPCDPIYMFFKAASKKICLKQINALRKCALAHISHGLNSAELVCQLASSVRTTFPRALIAALNVGSGVLHGGAIEECMRQTSNYLKSSLSAENFIQNLVETEKLIFGFGHRIHKINSETPSHIIAKDPRVSIYVNACIEGFPDKKHVIKKLVDYAVAVRKLNPNMGANTDFAASILFHCLEFSSELARGFFIAFRTPGGCAQIINELSIKGNSRRPPLSTVIPYC